jgi:hypothetical protein
MFYHRMQIVAAAEEDKKRIALCVCCTRVRDSIAVFSRSFSARDLKFPSKTHHLSG